MTSMGMKYPTSGLLTAIIGFDAVTVVYIHIGVGFGVARFDNWAMPEPLRVGRVTVDSHAFIMCSLTFI